MFRLGAGMHKLVAVLFFLFSFIRSSFADHAYVASTTGLYIVDTQTNTIISTISLNGAAAESPIAFNPTNTALYIPSDFMSASIVQVVDVATSMLTATISLTGTLTGTGGVTMTPTGFAYVSTSTGISVINTANNTVSTIIPLTNVIFIIANPNVLNPYVYVGVGDTTIQVINTNTNTIIATIALPSSGAPYGVLPNGNTLYVPSASIMSPDLFVMDAMPSFTVTDTVSFPTPFVPIQAFVSPDGTFAYIGVSNSTNIELVELDTATNTVTATIPAALNPEFGAFTLDSSAFYYNTGSPTIPLIKALDVATQQIVIVASLPDPTTFGGIAVLSHTDPVPPPIASPNGPQGKQIRNKFDTQTDIINEITWNAPIQGFTPAVYNIYRNSTLTDLAAVVPASELEFLDHNRHPYQIYAYYIVAEDSGNHTLTVGQVVVFPKY